ncbi:hypothetical protein AB4Y42_42770 [Paraburkholderia sp. EG286B]
MSGSGRLAERVAAFQADVGAEHAFVDPLSDSGASGTPGSATEKRAE